MNHQLYTTVEGIPHDSQGLTAAELVPHNDASKAAQLAALKESDPDLYNLLTQTEQPD